MKLLTTLLITICLFISLSAISIFATESKADSADNYRISTVEFKSDKLLLEGTLFLPNNEATKHPAIVFVNGSGPINRDGRVINSTTTPVLFYKKWASFLSSNGFATLRYDKRYITHKNINPIEITQANQIDDIISAVKYLQNRNDINQNKIVVLGHSEGGSIAPVAAQKMPEIAGVIAMAASAIPIDQLFIEQLKFQKSPYLEPTKRAFQMLKDNKFPKGGQIWGGGESYWREWIDYTKNVETIFSTLNKPIFLSQGLTDKNYPPEILKTNIKKWEGVANKSKKIIFKNYQNTTHSFLLNDTTQINETAFVDIINWMNSL